MFLDDDYLNKDRCQKIYFDYIRICKKLSDTEAASLQ